MKTVMKQIELTAKQEAKREKIEARVQKFNEACIKLFKRELVEGGGDNGHQEK